ncbi:MAG: hypothetical protein OXF20_04480 [Gammaproteobacteria bacterium]|nr:hypothetical protein [Gammaproteobacteria bacterium]
MSYDGSALATRPLKEFITPARLVMRHDDQSRLLPRVMQFASHTREFFDNWTL